MNLKQQKEVNLGEGSIGKLLLKLAVPSILAQLVNMLYNIVDRMYIGHIPEIGVPALTGVGLCFPIIILISAFSSLIGMGGAPQAAIHMGKGDKKQAEKILGNCVSALLICSVVLTAVFLITGRDLLFLFGASENTIGYAWDYMKIYICGTIFVQMSLGLNSFITTQGFSSTSMLTVVIGAVINIILDPIFIFAFDMGVEGAALATIISQAVSAIWVIKFLSGKRTKLKIKRSNLRIKKEIILPVLALGISPFVMQSTESILNISFNSSLYKYGGDLAVGCMTILSSVMQICMLPLQGMTQGAQPIISFNYGAGNSERVKKAFKLLLICSFSFVFILYLAIMIYPGIFVKIFNNSSQELLELTSWALRIYMAGTCVMSIQIACQQTFIAVGQAKVSLFLACLRKLILLIPLIYILPNFIENKVFAVFLAEPIADFVAALTTFIFFIKLFPKIISKEEKREAET